MKTKKILSPLGLRYKAAQPVDASTLKIDDHVIWNLRGGIEAKVTGWHGNKVLIAYVLNGVKFEAEVFAASLRVAEAVGARRGA